MNDLIVRIRRAIKFGLMFACLYSLYVICLYIVRGPRPFQSQHTAIASMIFSYFAGGVLAGGMVGALQPLTRFRIGAVLVYSIAAFFVFLSIAVVANGSLRQLQGVDWATCGILAVVTGVFGAFAWRNLL